MFGQTGKIGNLAVPLSSSVNMQCLPPCPRAARDGVDKATFGLASADQCGKVRAPPNLGRGYGGQQVLSVHNNILVRGAYHSVLFQ